MIVEKAAAKKYGTYERLNGGCFKEAYYMLTGRPGKELYPMPTDDAFYQKLKMHDSQGDVMWAGTSGSAWGVANNLVSGHAYSVIGARDYTDAAGMMWKLVNLRNPWGSTEYNGTFSDMDTVNMNSAALTALNHTLNSNDGTFWMPYSGYVQGFNYMGIGQWADTDKVTVLNSNWNRTLSQTSLSWTLSNPVLQDVYVGVVTQDGRDFMTNTCTADQRLKSGEAFVFVVRNSAGT